MKAHCLMNIGFEGPGYIADWMDQRGHSMQVWKLFENLSFPDIEDIDLLVIMGGPMNIYEEERYPFLVAEKELIKACIREQKSVLGICLGAQLIADALGEKVFKNREKEIGWFPVQRDGELEDNEIQQVFPAIFTPLHWHGETFDLPEGANLLGSSAACRIQGFLYGDHVIALQFHLEVTLQVVEGLLQHAADDLTEGAFVQSVAEIEEGLEYCPENKLILFQLLDRFLDPEQKNNWT
jgi:GMP synthase-like glutamine amidotransferase